MCLSKFYYPPASFHKDSTIASTRNGKDKKSEFNVKLYQKVSSDWVGKVVITESKLYFPNKRDLSVFVKRK